MTHAHAHTHTHTLTYTHIRTYAHTHAHTLTQARAAAGAKGKVAKVEKGQQPARYTKVLHMIVEGLVRQGSADTETAAADAQK